MRRFLGLLAISWTFASAAAASEVSLSVPLGGPFPDMGFEALADPADYGALGLSAKSGAFRLSEVPGDLLVLEFFNEHCLHCQRQAPLMQSFYQAAISGDLAGRLKVLAVGVGNRLQDVTGFRRQFRVTYPMAADPEFDRFMELGDPGGTPLTLFLARREGRWVLADSHLGMQGDTELMARSRVLLEGKGGTRGVASGGGGRRDAGAAEKDKDLAGPVKALLAAVSGQDVGVDSVELPGGVRIYRALGDGAKPTGLYARAAKREPVCDVCHAIHFLLAFDREGIIRGFETLYVTKYGNEEWSAEDVGRMRGRLVGRKMNNLPFDPGVDAVTSATMSSALIFDEARRTARVLETLGAK